MDSVTLWLNAAGSKAISQELTVELVVQLSKEEPGSKTYTKILNRICEGNLKLLYKTVKKYSDKRQFKWGTELSVDLLQAGYFGLRLAVERFDFSRGNKLSTCAVPWIRQRLGRHLVNKEQAIRVPENLVMEVHRRRSNNGLPSNLKSAPKTEDRFQAAESALSNHLSLDVRYGEDGGMCLSDIIEAPDTSNRYAASAKKLMAVKDLMAKAGLEPKTQDFLMEYARLGNIERAARKVGINAGRSNVIFHQAVQKCRDVV